MEWLIIIVFFAIIGFVVYKHAHAEDESIYTGEEKTKEYRQVAEDIQQEKPAYTNIYEYTKSGTIKRCAYCDAEMDGTTNICGICGNKNER